MTQLNSLFKQLAHNNHWSNARLYAACRQLSDEQFNAERASYFGSIQATLNHILIVDSLYLQRLKGEPQHSETDDEDETQLENLARKQFDVDQSLIRYIEAQNGQSLQSQVTFVRDNGESYTETVMDVLTHVFIHQVHHRGQVHDMLSQTGVTPPQLDEFFLKGDLKLREKELNDLNLSLK